MRIARRKVQVAWIRIDLGFKVRIARRRIGLKVRIARLKVQRAGDRIDLGFKAQMAWLRIDPGFHFLDQLWNPTPAYSRHVRNLDDAMTPSQRRLATRMEPLVESMAKRIGVRVPRVFVVDDPSCPAAGRSDRGIPGFLKLDQHFIGRADVDQPILEAVILHELSHLKHRDTLSNGAIASARRLVTWAVVGGTAVLAGQPPTGAEIGLVDIAAAVIVKFSN